MIHNNYVMRSFPNLL